MYISNIDTSEYSVKALYKSLYILSETSSGVIINTVQYSPSQIIQNDDLVTVNTKLQTILKIIQ